MWSQDTSRHVSGRKRGRRMKAKGQPAQRVLRVFHWPHVLWSTQLETVSLPFAPRHKALAELIHLWCSASSWTHPSDPGPVHPDPGPVMLTPAVSPAGPDPVHPDPDPTLPLSPQPWPHPPNPDYFHPNSGPIPIQGPPSSSL